MSTRPPDRSFASRRVLAVDNSAWSEVALRILLEASGYQVLAARDGHQALVLAGSFRPHLILAELDLPDMDGLTLIRRLKGRADTRDSIVVALTTRLAGAMEAEVLAAGGAGLMTKPVDPAAFRESLRNYLPK